MKSVLEQDIEKRVGNYAEGRRRWPRVLPAMTVKQFLRMEYRQSFSESRCRDIFEKHPETFRAAV